ncbi:RadC family protein [Sphingomonas xinjiangensis]|uniref:DNA repair protein RadC n=1 Tax=Sphingomonas xinjiangensis TaxID=643568 RepID=A0A840YH73_9SPHN|nr:DNA repair protein RadC [Sphingomonas xinjiangensis]
MAEDPRDDSTTPLEGDTSPPDNSGHRGRLRKRLFEGGPDALLDHELVEYLLALAIPRRDTKPLAKALLLEFGGIAGLFTADAEAIARFPGMGEISTAAIKVPQAAALRLLRAQVAERPVLANWQALLDYLRADMAHHTIERVRVLHLNSKNMLIRDELMNEGSIDEAPVYVREVIRRAIDPGSAAIILVHNHPSGDPSPSRADIEITRAVAEAGKRLNIVVHDHVIIGAEGHTSLRAKGLI